MKVDFIDIGTSDFRYTVPTSNQNGIYVEPVKRYIDSIPEYPNTHKVHAAVCKRSGTEKIYYLPLETISSKRLPDWLRGCNQMYGIHPTIKRECERLNLNYEELVKSEDVECITMKDLVDKFGIKEIVSLKIDTEGYDCDIVLQVVELVRNKKIKINTVNFETNSLADKDQLAYTFEVLHKNKWVRIPADGAHDSKFRYEGDSYATVDE